MADWYVYQHDGDPLGPWSTDTVADAILEGKLAPDVWVAAPGGPRWLRALDVPVIGQLVEGIPTRPRRDSGMRLMPGAPGLYHDDTATVRTTPASADETVQVHVPTRGIYTREDAIAFAADDDEPTTDRAMPPSSSSEPTIPFGDDAVALAHVPVVADRRRRSNG